MRVYPDEKGSLILKPGDYGKDKDGAWCFVLLVYDLENLAGIFETSKFQRLWCACGRIQSKQEA